MLVRQRSGRGDLKDHQVLALPLPDRGQARPGRQSDGIGRPAWTSPLFRCTSKLHFQNEAPGAARAEHLFSSRPRQGPGEAGPGLVGVASSCGTPVPPPRSSA